jgi:hypothetical protein
MEHISIMDLPPMLRKAHAEYRRNLALALRDPTLSEVRRKEIAILLEGYNSNGVKPYAALASIRKEHP